MKVGACFRCRNMLKLASTPVRELRDWSIGYYKPIVITHHRIIPPSEVPPGRPSLISFAYSIIASRDPIMHRSPINPLGTYLPVRTDTRFPNSFPLALGFPSVPLLSLSLSLSPRLLAHVTSHLVPDPGSSLQFLLLSLSLTLCSSSKHISARLHTLLPHLKHATATRSSVNSPPLPSKPCPRQSSRS